MVTLAAQTVFHFSNIILSLNREQWPGLSRPFEVNRDFESTSNPDVYGTHVPPCFQHIARIVSRLTQVVSFNQEIHASLSHLCQSIRNGVDPSPRTRAQKRASAVSEALQLMDHLCDLYDIIILATEQVIAMLRPIPAQFYPGDRSNGYSAVEGVHVPVDKIPAVYAEYQLCFKLDQQSIAPLLLDSRWSTVREKTRPRKGRT